MNDILKKMHEKVIEKKNALRKHRAALKTHQVKLLEIFADVEALGGEPHSDGDWVFVPVAGDKHKFLAFARLIRKHGFKLPEIEKGATGFTRLEYLGSGDNTLPLYFQFSSTACRRVKVGTQTVVQDVYETVCDEVTPYAESTPASMPEPANSIPF